MAGQRTRYAYPPSSSASRSRSPTRAVPLPARLRALQADLTALEAELADPSNPALQASEQDGEGAGEMIRGLVDVRRRLERVRRGREGRGKLVGVVLEAGESKDEGGQEEGQEESKNSNTSEVSSLVEMDKRVGELEKLVGSVSATLDEVRMFVGSYAY